MAISFPLNRHSVPFLFIHHPLLCFSSHTSQLSLSLSLSLSLYRCFWGICKVSLSPFIHCYHLILQFNRWICFLIQFSKNLCEFWITDIIWRDLEWDEKWMSIGWLGVWVVRLKSYLEDEISLLWEIMQLMTSKVSWKNAKMKMNLNF